MFVCSLVSPDSSSISLGLIKLYFSLWSFESLSRAEYSKWSVLCDYYSSARAATITISALVRADLYDYLLDEIKLALSTVSNSLIKFFHCLLRG